MPYQNQSLQGADLVSDSRIVGARLRRAIIAL
jgi:hypothetical protein